MRTKGRYVKRQNIQFKLLWTTSIDSLTLFLLKYFVMMLIILLLYNHYNGLNEIYEFKKLLLFHPRQLKVGRREEFPIFNFFFRTFISGNFGCAFFVWVGKILQKPYNDRCSFTHTRARSISKNDVKNFIRNINVT